MSHLEEHHDHALMLLVGRSLEDGIPWTVEKDQAHIARERVLWELMTDDERHWEQEFLGSLWRAREEERAYPVNHEWGDWTKGLPKRIKITDTAFGLPKNAYRPFPKGKIKAPEGYVKTFDWLWEKGFQIIDVGPIGFSLSIPPHRVVQEADRLKSLLERRFPDMNLRPYGHGGGVQFRSCYDPFTRGTVIEVSGLSDETFKS